MKSFWFFMTICLIGFLSIACQKTNTQKKNPSSQQILTAQEFKEFSIPPSIPEFSKPNARSLKKHWNLVSFPIETPTDVQSFLETSGHAANIQSIWSWDRSLGSGGNWRVYPSHENYEVLQTIVPDAGYWIRAKQNFEFTGTGTSSNLYNFSEGWNLIGISHNQQNISVTDFFTQGDFWQNSCGTGATYESLWVWQNNTWKVHFSESGKLEEFNTQNGTSFEELNTLESGMGAWIRVFRDNTPPTPNGCSNEFLGTWINVLTLSEYLKINADNSVHYCDTETVDFGSLENNVHTFSSNYSTPNLQQNLSVSGDSLLVDGTLTYHKIQELPSTCIDLIANYDVHGDDASSATVLELDTSINGKIETDEDTDFFTFTPQTTGTYQFHSTGNIDTNVILYNSSITQIASDDNSGEGNNFKLNETLEASQNYYFEIKSSEIGEYNLLLSFVEDNQDDHGNNNNSATVLNLDTVVNGNIEVSGDIDVFSFYSNSSTVYEFKSLGDTDTQVRLLDDNGFDLGLDTNSGEGNNFTIRQHLTANVTYYFHVSHENRSQTGQYQVVISLLGQIEDDHGDDEFNATSLLLNEVLEGNIEIPLDEDYFHFSPTESGLYAIESTGNTDTFGSIYHSVYGYMGGDDQGGEGDNFLMYQYLDAQNTYYFSVTSMESGNYSISVKGTTDIHSDEISNATMLEIGMPLNGLLNSYGDEDYFSFTPFSSETYLIFALGPLEPSIDLLDSDGNILAQNDGNTSSDGFLSYELEANQEYFIKVFSGRFIADYRINVAPEQNQDLESRWYSEVSGEGYFFWYDTGAFLCVDSTKYWSLTPLTANFILDPNYLTLTPPERSNAWKHLKLDSDVLTIDDSGRETGGFNKVSQLGQTCETYASHLFAPSNYEGIWYRESEGSDFYYQIDENKVIQGCYSTNDSYEFFPAAPIEGNIVQYFYSQTLLNLSDGILSVIDQFGNNDSYQKVSSLPTECDEVINGN